MNVEKLSVLVLLVHVIILPESNCVFLKANQGRYVAQLHRFIRDLKLRMCHQIKEFNIPKLEPFEMEHLPLNVSSEFADIKGDIDNLHIEGLSTVEVKNDELNLLNLQMDIVIPQVRITGRHSVQGNLGGIPLNGKGGDFRIILSNITICIEGKFYFGRSDDETFLQLELKKLEPHLDNGTFNIEQLINDDELNKFLNLVLTRLAPIFLEETWKDVDKTAKEFVENAIRSQKLGNDMLTKFVLGQSLFNSIKPTQKCPEITLPYANRKFLYLNST